MICKEGEVKESVRTTQVLGIELCVIPEFDPYSSVGWLRSFCVEQETEV